MEAPVGDDVRVVGAALAAQKVRFVLAGFLALRRGVGGCLFGDRHVPDRVLVDLDRELLLHGHRMEAGGLLVLRLDQVTRHAVAGEVIEADILEGVAQLGGGFFGGARLAGEEARHVDQGNFAADQQRGDELPVCGLDGWLHRRPPDTLRER
jgi:hypothetical protein